MSEKLKACPFCGGTDLTIEPWCVMPDDYHAALVTCADCEIEGPSSLTLPEPDGCWVSTDEEAIELGAKAWNRRAQDFDTLAQRLQEAERLLGEARQFTVDLNWSQRLQDKIDTFLSGKGDKS